MSRFKLLQSYLKAANEAISIGDLFLYNEYRMLIRPLLKKEIMRLKMSYD